MCFLFLLSIVCFVFNDLRYELVLHYVDIDGIVDTHYLAFLFNNTFLLMSTIFLLDFQTVVFFCFSFYFKDYIFVLIFTLHRMFLISMCT